MLELQFAGRKMEDLLNSRLFVRALIIANLLIALDLPMWANRWPYTQPGLWHSCYLNLPAVDLVINCCRGKHQSCTVLDQSTKWTKIFLFVGSEQQVKKCVFGLCIPSLHGGFRFCSG